ncbi:MAG: hypothetical protein EPO47_10610 [Rugosibacter sp.]|nr:MAG: hypothetical protein EPO47_10610 [Rugosibacter sp.]
MPREERTRLVDSLLQTLSPADDSTTAAWVAVARRRLEPWRFGFIQRLKPNFLPPSTGMMNALPFGCRLCHRNPRDNPARRHYAADQSLPL